jgi:hypothetical protein
MYRMKAVTKLLVSAAALVAAGIILTQDVRATDCTEFCDESYAWTSEHCAFDSWTCGNDESSPSGCSSRAWNANGKQVTCWNIIDP